MIEPDGFGCQRGFEFAGDRGFCDADFFYRAVVADAEKGILAGDIDELDGAATGFDALLFEGESSEVDDSDIARVAGGDKSKSNIGILRTRSAAGEAACQSSYQQRSTRKHTRYYEPYRMWPALLFALQLPVALPTPLEEWKAEIEARAFHRIEIIRIPGDPVPDEDRDVLFSYFNRPDFAAQFARTQALTFRYVRGERTRSLILLNLPMMQNTQNSAASLIAHELGHLWLASLGFSPPVYEPGPRGCLAIHYGDMVQHILLRAESDRRGIPWRPSYERDYTAASESLRNAPPQGLGDDCFRAQRLSLMVDVRTGFETKSFGAREEYLSLLAKQDPEAEAIAIELTEALDGKLGLEKESYEWALEQSRAAVNRLIAGRNAP